MVRGLDETREWDARGTFSMTAGASYLLTKQTAFTGRTCSHSPLWVTRNAAAGRTNDGLFNVRAMLSYSFADSLASAGNTVTRAQGLGSRQTSAFLPASKFAGSSHVSKARFRAAHSLSIIENQAVSRFFPFTIMCCRKIPSNVNPRRNAALRDGELFESHFHS